VFSPGGHLTTTAGRVSLSRHMPPPSAHLFPIKEAIRLEIDRFPRTDPAKTWCLWSFLDTERVIPSTGRPPVDLLGEVKRGEETARLGVSF
jgi:hypothetical protein